MNSLAKKIPQDSQGNALPWMNFSIIELLNERLKSEHTLFEFGSGYSTYYYAGRVKEVTSVEYDQQWFDTVNSKKPNNVKLIFQAQDQGSDYCSIITKQNCAYDVVVIDGRDRVNCFKHAIKALSPMGVIILDDSDRPRYSEAFEVAKMESFRVLSMTGLKPTGTARDQTSIFYRSENCFQI
jgi:predicted O-methyltransferase YrrM